MNNCRICFGSGELFRLGCSCSDDLNYIHINCADQWFSDRMFITLSGKLKEPSLLVKYKVTCEICNHDLSHEICTKIYQLYDKNLKIVKK